MASQLVASKLIFLADLPGTQPGDKVRFLGCIVEYDSFSGMLVLSHSYKGSRNVAKVSIEHVRETLPTLSTMTGTWVNVVGYVLRHGDSEAGEGSMTEVQATEMLQKPDRRPTWMQATMMWNAGGMNLQEYEVSLQARKDAEATMAASVDKSSKSMC